MTLRYKIGDALYGERQDCPLLIPHITNSSHRWGRGFVLAVSDRWPEPERAYRAVDSTLGSMQFVDVGDRITVVNMCAQDGLISRHKKTPLVYDVLSRCLEQVAAEALMQGAEIHMPRIGAGLGGGEWNLIQKIIDEQLVRKGLDVTVFDLKSHEY